MNATLTRIESGDEGTFGNFVTDSGWSWVSGELPWRDNQRKISCIPAGTYECTWHKSPSKGWVYQVNDVPDRDDILIHVANFCGDEEKGYKTDVLGCIGLGHNIGYLDGQKVITNSGAAIKEFGAEMNQEPFTLTIMWFHNIGQI